MLTIKIASIALIGIVMLSATSITAFATEPVNAVGADSSQLIYTKQTPNPESTQDIKLENITRIIAEYNPELHSELVGIIAEHDEFHRNATASQVEHQEIRELEVAAIIESAEAGEITRAEAYLAFEQMKAETAEITAALQTIKANKTQEDGQLKALIKAIGNEIIDEFSSESPDIDTLNRLFTEFVQYQQLHLEIDYRYQAQIDELLGTS